jgi:hypothetical protein
VIWQNGWRRFVVPSLLIVAIAAPALAQIQPEGSEIQIARSVNRELAVPRAATSPSGTVLVVWRENLAGIRGAYVDRGGSLIGGRLALVANVELPGLPGEGDVVTNTDPAAVFLPSGDFLLFWTAESAFVRADIFIEHRWINRREVMVQRFDSQGQPRGGAMPVHEGATGWFENRPVVLPRPGGDFIVAWEASASSYAPPPSDGLFLRRVGPNGKPVGPQIRVDGGTHLVSNPALAASTDGSFLVAWESEANGKYLLARAFDAAGAAARDAFRLHPPDPLAQRRPALIAAGDGYLVAWQGNIAIDESRIFGRFLGSSGHPSGEVFQISQGRENAQLTPALARQPEGGYLVTWRAWKDNRPLFSIAAVTLAENGTPASDERWLNDRRIHKTALNVIASDGRGGFFVPWIVAVPRPHHIDYRVVGRWLHAD